jgi:hypothetical protein
VSRTWRSLDGRSQSQLTIDICESTSDQSGNGSQPIQLPGLDQWPPVPPSDGQIVVPYLPPAPLPGMAPSMPPQIGSQVVTNKVPTLDNQPDDNSVPPIYQFMP